jgi:hypothetical protein
MDIRRGLAAVEDRFDQLGWELRPRGGADRADRAA